MIIYFVVLAHFALYLLFYKWADRQKKTIFLLVSFICIFIIYGLRNQTVGIDTVSYMKYFDLYAGYSLKDLIIGNSWFRRLDPAFIVLAKAVSLLGLDFNAYITITGVIYSIIFIALLFRINSYDRYKFAYLFFSLYFVCSGLNIMRQAFATLILLHAFLCFQQKKWKNTIILCVISSLFHAGAIIVCSLLLVYMIFGRTSNKAKLVKYLSVVGLVSIVFIYQFVFKLFGLEIYSSSEKADVSIYNIVALIFLYLIYIYKKSLNKSDAYNYCSAFIETSIIASVVCCVLGGVSVGFIRITTIIFPFSIFALLDSINGYCKINKNILVMEISFYIFSLIYFCHSITSNIGGVVPFEFMWSKV